MKYAHALALEQVLRVGRRLVDGALASLMGLGLTASRSVLAADGGDLLSVAGALSRRVRTAESDAFIVYKPHPDVAAGHRKGAMPDELARQYADIVVQDVSISDLLDKGRAAA